MFNVPKIPVILVTGFLGSGKTTFLRRLAETHPNWHMVFLVNEFAELSVDGETLAATGTATHSVVGGSLFCECKAGDFLRIMREEVLTMHREQALDAVVIETSGTADPDAIGQLMLDHGLGEEFEVRSIISIVAPARFLKMIANLPVIESQIAVSDLVVINKTDTADEATIAAVESEIRIRNSNTKIIRAEQCRIDYILPGNLEQLPQGTLSTCEANPFDTMEAQWPSKRSIEEARTWLETLPPEILRIKGHIQTPQGNWLVERTVDTLTIEPSQQGRHHELVFIAHEDHLPHLENARHALAQLN
jgi:G3E family GTPase